MIRKGMQLRLVFYHIIPIRQVVTNRAIEELWRRIHIHPSPTNHRLPRAIISAQCEAGL